MCWCLGEWRHIVQPPHQGVPRVIGGKSFFLGCSDAATRAQADCRALGSQMNSAAGNRTEMARYSSM